MAGLESFIANEEFTIRPPTRSKSPKLLRQVKAANHNRDKLSLSYEHVSKSSEELLLTFGLDSQETPRFVNHGIGEETKPTLMAPPKRMPFLKNNFTITKNKVSHKTNNDLIALYKNSPKLESDNFNRLGSQLAIMSSFSFQNPNHEDPDRMVEDTSSREREKFKRKLALLRLQGYDKSMKFRPLVNRKNMAPGPSKCLDMNELKASRQISVKPTVMKKNPVDNFFKRSNSFQKLSSIKMEKGSVQKWRGSSRMLNGTSDFAHVPNK